MGEQEDRGGGREGGGCLGGMRIGKLVARTIIAALALLKCRRGTMPIEYIYVYFVFKVHGPSRGAVLFWAAPTVSRNLVNYTTLYGLTDFPQSTY
jgi:hypothetical protein